MNVAIQPLEHSVLTQQEAAGMPDLRELTPDLEEYLLPGEKVIMVKYQPPYRPERHPSSARELTRLSRVSSAEEIGNNGPVVAALALSDNETRPEFRLYETLYGRDSLRVASNLLEDHPKLAKSTLLTLARLQGTNWNAEREEEPGRVIHETREPDDPIAKMLSEERGWGWPYYGAVDSTVEYIRLFTAYVATAQDGEELLHKEYEDLDGNTHKMSYSLDQAVGWTVRMLQDSPEGLLEFKSAIPNGLENQVWKDSWDAYFHADGTLANHQDGIASVEVQRVAYDALLDAAELYEDKMGTSDAADQMRKLAGNLRERLLSDFWVEEDGGYFALGIDHDENGNLRQIKVKTSNMGHLLRGRLLEGDDPEIVRKREAVIRQLFSPLMLASAGIRTLAVNEPRFRPGAYHNGSVWLWDNYLIIQGLEHHGYNQLAENLKERLFKVIEATHIFPEYVRGNFKEIPEVNDRVVELWDETYQKVNRIEQPPQQVQAWTVAAIHSILQSDKDLLTKLGSLSRFEVGVLAETNR